jgi:type I restriction enzyme M protein
VFYGAGVPACLLILRKQRLEAHRDKLLLIYAARPGQYRELSAQNELRPQDVMRILVHYHAYGDASKVPQLVEQHSGRIRKQIDFREDDEVGRLQAEYQDQADKLPKIDSDLTAAGNALNAATTKTAKDRDESAMTKLQKQREKIVAKLAERDERIAAARRRAADDRRDVDAVSAEMIAVYGDPDELIKHARVVGMDEVGTHNEFNLNVPRYVDTFEPEPRVDVKDAIAALQSAENEMAAGEQILMKLLRETGYETH